MKHFLYIIGIIAIVLSSIATNTLAKNATNSTAYPSLTPHIAFIHSNKSLPQKRQMSARIRDISRDDSLFAEPLLGLLTHSDPIIQQNIAISLWKIPEESIKKQSLNFIIDALHNNDHTIRNNALYTLVGGFDYQKDTALTSALIHTHGKKLLPLFEALFQESNDNIRFHALLGISMTNYANPNTLTLLKKQLPVETNNIIQTNMIRMLTSTPTAQSEIIPILLPLISYEQPEITTTILRSIAERPQLVSPHTKESVLDKITHIMHDWSKISHTDMLPPHIWNHAHITHAAISAFYNIDQNAAKHSISKYAKIYLASLTHEQPTIRASSALVLGAINHITEIGPYLLTQLKNDPYAIVRKHTITALSQIPKKPKDTVATFIDIALHDPEYTTRYTAILALGRLGAVDSQYDQSITHTLITLIKDTDQSAAFSVRHQLRLHAIMALGTIGPKAEKAVPLLIALLKQYPEHFEDNILLTLRHIGGKEAKDFLKHYKENV